MPTRIHAENTPRTHCTVKPLLSDHPLFSGHLTNPWK